MAASVASSSWSPSRPVAATRIGRVAACPATTTRLSTRTATGSRRSRRIPIMARIDSGSSSLIDPAVCWISSVRKKALPPVAACSSLGGGIVAPVHPQQLGDVVRGQPVDGERVSNPSLPRPAAHRSRSGVGSSAGTRTVATTSRRPGCSWRRTWSIIVNDGDVGPLQVVDARSAAGTRRTRPAPARRRSRTGGTARRWVGPLEMRFGHQLLELGQQQRRAGRAGMPRERLRASGDMVRRIERTASTIGSNGTSTSAVARPHITMAPDAWASWAKREARCDLPAPASPWSRTTCVPPRRPASKSVRLGELAVTTDERTRCPHWSTPAGKGTGDGPGGSAPPIDRRRRRHRRHAGRRHPRAGRRCRARGRG